MAGRGHAVTIAAPAESRILPEAYRRGLNAVDLAIARKGIRGVMNLHRFLKRNAVDVVNTHSSTDSWLAALACAALGNAPPIVRTRHISAPVPRNRATRWLYVSATRHIVTTGESLRRQLIEANGFPEGHITSVPTGIDTQRFVPGERMAARRALDLPPEAILIGIVATLRSWKGHRFLLDAFAGLQQSDCILVIVGDGPQRDNLQAQIAALNIGARVRMAGNQTDVLPWLQALDIFALPSYANEGVPQALLQAMLCALPCVTTGVGSIGEAAVHEHSALIVAPQDPGALRQALARLVESPGLRQALGEAARAHCEKGFSFEHMLDRMEGIFRDAVRKDSSRIRARLAIMPRALWALARSAGRRRLPRKPARILVAHNLLLGDTLMLTPLLAKLAARFPGASVVMTVSPAVANLYAGRPYGVRVMPCDPRDSASYTALFSEPGYDLAIVPGDNRYSWLAAAAGSGWIVAFGGDRPAYKSWPVDELRPYPSKAQAWGDMMAGLVDGAAPAQYRVADWPDPPSRPFAAPEGRYGVLHVGASTVLKQWEPSKWRVLATALGERGLGVVWGGGPGEDRVVSQIDPEGRHRSYAGRLDLAQMWRLLKGANLLVCPDTGIAHLGRIVGVPTVTLFGPGSAVLGGAGEFWRSSPYRAVTVKDFPCRDQRILFKRDIAWVRRCGRGTGECERPLCMEAITPEQVLAQCDGLAGRMP